MLQHDLVHNPQFVTAFKDVVIYGVAGTNGSGKDSLMDVLAEHGFLIYNTSNNIRRVAQAALGSTSRGGNDTPMGRVANAQRAMYPGGMVELGLLDWLFIAGHLPQELKPRGLVIGSIRGVNEAKRLKEVGGKLIAVDADPHIRYQRLADRRRADDPPTFDAFQAQEAGDMAVGQTDPTKFGMAAVIDQADIRIVNDGNDFKVFKAKILETLLL